MEMDVHLRKLAARQEDLVGAWQLRDIGWSEKKVRCEAQRGAWRTIYRGVYSLSHAPLSQERMWLAATLTAPNSFLSHSCAGARYRFYRYVEPIEMITRPGNRGRRRHGRLVVFHSTTLDGHTRRLGNLPITSPERTMVDLAVRLSDDAVRRMFRESVRLKATTIPKLRRVLHGQPGSRLLTDLTTRYAHLPLHRARSDAECLGLQILHDAGQTQWLLNHRIDGQEADLVDVDRRRIIEIDGPQYHLFADEDARKQAIWEGAGFEVRRIGSDGVYAGPAALLQLARR
jgi:hypothetical protein